MSQPFRFTERHYSIITKQAADNFPQEAGGFLGGKDRQIQAILPIFNQHMENKTDTFGFTGQDIERAHQFFSKHGLEYYGLYHSHPSGVAFPSKTDINTGHKYHFIVGLNEKDPKKADFRAFEIIKRQPFEVPIHIVPNDAFTPIDIQNKSAKEFLTDISHSGRSFKMEDEAGELDDRIDAIRQNKNRYQRLDPKNRYTSDFSTFA